MLINWIKIERYENWTEQDGIDWIEDRTYWNVAKILMIGIMDETKLIKNVNGIHHRWRISRKFEMELKR